MSAEEKVVYIAAELTIGSKTEKVTINSLSMTSCVARMEIKIKQYQPAILRLFEDKGNNELSPFRSIKTTIESTSQKKIDPDAYYVKIKFNSMVKANQGVVQLLHSGKYTVENNTPTVITTEKNSLRVTSVSCHMCEKKNIPFWILRSRTMLTKFNIFGVPNYVGAMTGRDFCDYNLIRVVVCPRCYFASNDPKDFYTGSNNKNSLPLSFSKAAICDQWEEKIEDRKSLLGAHLENFFGEERLMDQALLSYDLGILTSDAIFSADEDKDPKRRNYNPARKSVLYIMFKAELLMIENRPQEAEKLLEDAIIRLENIYPYLRNEASIRVGFLLGMINLYLEDYKKVGQYLTFLRDYNKEGKIKKGSDEYKTLMTNAKKLDEAYQNREEYSKTKLTKFQKPF